MLILLEALNRASAFLAERGIQQARLDSEWLFAEVLNCKRLDLYLQFERPLDETVLSRLRPLFKRRAQREPLQYILGWTDFCGLTLQTDRRALIPRPETEELIECITQSLPDPPQTILDLGTGSGALAIALTQHYPEAQTTAIDHSSEALALARGNATALGVANRITFRQSDWFKAVRGRFDLIVANPPYLSEREFASTQPEVRDYEPQLALVAEQKGLAALEQILCQAPAYLGSEGCLALETGIDHHNALKNMAERTGYSNWHSLQDLSRRDRFFLARLSIQK